MLAKHRQTEKDVLVSETGEGVAPETSTSWPTTGNVSRWLGALAPAGEELGSKLSVRAPRRIDGIGEDGIGEGGEGTERRQQRSEGIASVPPEVPEPVRRRRGVGQDLAAQTAGTPHGPWRLSNSPALTLAFPNASLAALSICRIAVYGPVCTVVWEGRSREAPPTCCCRARLWRTCHTSTGARTRQRLVCFSPAT
jgi:hypothetical protein